MDASTLVSTAIDDLLASSKLSDVLLKIKAVAYLIGSEELKAWVKYESDGYYKVKWEIIPSYREIPLSVRGNLAPVYGRGWQPNQILATEVLGNEIHRMLTHEQLPQGVSELEHLAQRNEPFHIDIAPTLVRDMNNVIYSRSQWRVHSAWRLGMPTSIEGVLGAIRSKLLELLLEIKVEFGDTIPLQALQSSQQKQAVNDIVSKSLPTINAAANSIVHVTLGNQNVQATNRGVASPGNSRSSGTNQPATTAYTFTPGTYRFNSPMPVALRSEPNIEAEQLYSCPRNAVVKVIEDVNEMYCKATVDGHTGYLSKRLLAINQPEPTIVIPVPVAVSKPPVAATWKPEMSGGTSNYKYKTTFNSPFSPPLREAPNVNAGEVYICPRTAVVYVLGETQGGYCKVAVNGRVGYVSAALLTRSL